MLPALLLLLLPGAPAPPYRPPPPPPVVGSWLMVWGDVEGPATFAPGGAYRWTCAGREWAGRWTWDAKSRTLTVEEACVPSPWSSSWSVTLDRRLRGTPRGWGPARFRLLRINPEVRP